MGSSFRESMTALRDTLRDWVEGSPLERPALWMQDRASPPSASVLAERRDLDLMRQLIGRVLERDASAIDVGANIGRITRMCVKQAPAGKHFAFEPTPRLASRLRQRFPQVQVVQAAAGDQAGDVTFYQQIANHPQSGLAKPDGARDDLRTLTVPMQRIDDVIPAGRQVRLIKIDVEGAESLVLRGAMATIRRCRPVIVFEYGMSAVETFGVTPTMMHELLTDELDMKVVTLAGFLDDEQALSRSAFEAVCAKGAVWNFAATP